MNDFELTWRDVFDGSKFPPGTHIGEAVYIAYDVHYYYLGWNGRVYAIRMGSSGFLEWDELPILTDNL